MKKWTQDDLASFLSVSRQAVSKWENAVSLPDLEVLLHLSKLFSLTVNDLIEKPIQHGISSFEEITKVNKEIIIKVLSRFQITDVIIAAKGASPAVCKLLIELFPESNLENEIKLIGPVRVSDVELVHNKIIEMINLSLIESRGL